MPTVINMGNLLLRLGAYLVTCDCRDVVVVGCRGPARGRLDRREQGRETEGALVADRVDEEGRRDRDPAADAAIADAPDLRGVDVGAHLSPELKEIQAGLGRAPVEAKRVGRRLAFEEAVVHLPESALRGRALGGLGSRLGVLELVGLGEAAVDVAQERAHLFLDLLDRAVRLRARGRGKVAVGHQRRFREGRTADVVFRRDLSRESLDLSLSFHRATIQDWRCDRGRGSDLGAAVVHRRTMIMVVATAPGPIVCFARVQPRERCDPAVPRARSIVSVAPLVSPAIAAMRIPSLCRCPDLLELVAPIPAVAQRTPV